MKKTICTLLCALLLLALIPAGAVSAADGDALRDVVVAQAQADATVGPWRMLERYTGSNMTEDQKTLYRSQGCRPPVYFEYRRMLSYYVGVPYSPDSVSYEVFKNTIGPDGYLPPLIDNFDNLGMNVNSFLTDVLSRVATGKITGVKSALTADSLTGLLPAADLKAKSSKAAVAALSAGDVDAAYAKLAKGDLLLAWDDGVDVTAPTPLTTMEPNIHVMIVTGVDAAARKVNVLYPASGVPVYTFKCDKCGAIDTEGPQFNPVPDHMVSVNYAYDHYKKHSETDKSSSCDGTWTPVSASTYLNDTVSYDQLAGRTDGVAAVAASSGYLPYTLKAYSAGAAEADVRVVSNATAENVAAGFKADITSNYRIIKVDAVLTKAGQPEQRFTNYADWDSWTFTYENAELNAALLSSDAGKYTLKLDVTTGPVTNAATLAVPVVTAWSMEFDLAAPAFTLRADTARVTQGKDVTIDVLTMLPGLTGAAVTLTYDSERFTLNKAAVRTADSKVSVKDDGKGTVSVQYFGSALSSGASVAKLPFTAVPSGKLGYTADQFEPFIIPAASAATKVSPAAADLAPARVGGKPISLAIGPVISIHKDYIKGYDLVLAFCDVDAEGTYDGTAMLDFSIYEYKVNGTALPTTLAFIAKNADESKVEIKDTTNIKQSKFSNLQYYTRDVNSNGCSDLADAQAILSVRAGLFPPETRLKECLLADVDRNCRVDEADALMLMRDLTK